MKTEVTRNKQEPYLYTGENSPNPYSIASPMMFTALKELIERNPKNYHHELRSSSRYSETLRWVESATPILSDLFYKVSTKCAWIMHGIVCFPACEGCGRPFTEKNVSVRKGYPRFCSAKCNCSSAETIRRSQARKLSEYGSAGWNTFKAANNSEKSRETRYAQNGGKWEKPDTQEKRKATNLRKYGYICNLQSSENKEKSRLTNIRVRGVEHSMQDQRVVEKSIRTKRERYGNARGDPSHFTYVPTRERLEKNIATCMRLYGITNGGASREAQIKAHAKYIYCGKSFDSSPELAFEIWLNDKHINHSYRDGSYIEYQYEYAGKMFKSRYYYDFKLACGLIVEIKGRHLLDDNMKLVNPYIKKAYEKGKITEDEYLRIIAKYAAKQLCMESNHIIVLTNDGYKVYEDYVSETNGKDYIKRFRNAQTLE